VGLEMFALEVASRTSILWAEEIVRFNFGLELFMLAEEQGLEWPGRSGDLPAGYVATILK
jgi:hypothetical protein